MEKVKDIINITIHDLKIQFFDVFGRDFDLVEKGEDDLFQASNNKIITELEEDCES